jgi:hypothetical protein
MVPIELYSELLTNIRTVTLVASLKTESNHETKAELSADGQNITVSHEGHTASIRLPTQMNGGGTAALTLPARPSKDLTLRLQLEEKAPGLLKFENGTENLVPWPASAMNDGVQCRKCGTNLLRGNAITEWKDLPNENWAEMMDFWHCHKPHEHNHNHDASNSKGYSSSNKFKAVPGNGLVGLSYIILATDDCANIKVGTHPSISHFHYSPSCKPSPVKLSSMGLKRKGPVQLRATSTAWFLIRTPQSNVVATQRTEKQKKIHGWPLRVQCQCG